MRKIKKKMISIALVSVLALSGIPYSLTAHAEETATKTDAEAAVVTQDEIEKENLEEVQAGTLAVNETNFPDAVFRSYLLEEFDPDGDEMIDPGEVTEISFYDHSGLTSLKGIESFPNLESLSCYDNDLTSLDMSGNPSLTYLNCYNNNLTSLNVSKNLSLEVLDCGCNNLTSLDVSNNSSLEMLWCSDNNLASLDVSKNAALKELECFGNDLTSLDVSCNPALETLTCYNNNLTSLNVSQNPALWFLYCNDNNLTALNLSNNTGLTWLGYDYDKISGLNLSNLTSLESLRLYFQELPENGTLDLSGVGYQMEGMDMSKVSYSLSQMDTELYTWSGNAGEKYINIVAHSLKVPLKIPTVTGIYHLSQDRNGIVAGLCTEGIDKSKYEFSWYVCKDGKNWIMAQDWTAGYEWLSYQPDENGEYVLVGKVRPIGGDDTNTVQESSYFSYHHEIYGKCQMPYEGEGGGYLIGFESYENPNQSYQYEMLILDCTKLANGEDAWIYTTGKCGVADGKALWTVWQPQYGYYWTLFRLYDADGNMLDEVCYGFQNI